MVALQVIGGGRMGEALVGGLLSAGGQRLDALRVVEPDPARLAALQRPSLASTWWPPPAMPTARSWP